MARQPRSPVTSVDPRQIVVTATPGAEGEAAVEAALAIAARSDAEVVFLRVAPPVEYRYFRGAPPRPLLRRLFHGGDAVLDEAAARAWEEGVPFRRERVAGDPAEAILDCADDVDADLIVIGQRSRWGGSSLARRVRRRTSRPVLVARSVGDAEGRQVAA